MPWFDQHGKELEMGIYFMHFGNPVDNGPFYTKNFKLEARVVNLGIKMLLFKATQKRYFLLRLIQAYQV